MMTNREVFDKVRAHLLAQGKKSMNNNYNCCYRDDDGLSCAVGCLISNESYDSSIEGVGISGLYEKDGLFTGNSLEASKLAKALNDANVPTSASEILLDLQRLHDLNDPATWEEKLAQLEKDYFGE